MFQRGIVQFPSVCSGTPMSLIRIAHSTMIKIVLFVTSGARRRRGGAELLSRAVGIVLLDWCRKIYTSDLSLIFFYILDEAAEDEEGTKV